jgi:type IV pilus biogenesis protein CpaD/CtpE
VPRWRLAANVAILAALAGCSSNSRPTTSGAPRFVEDALPIARRIVDGTTAATARGISVTPDTRWAETECENAKGEFDRTFSAPYVVVVHVSSPGDAVRLVESIRSFWVARRYQTSTVITNDLPRVHASTSGFQLTAEALRAVAEVQVGADTPCLPRKASP